MGMHACACTIIYCTIYTLYNYYTDPAEIPKDWCMRTHMHSVNYSILIRLISVSCMLANRIAN